VRTIAATPAVHPALAAAGPPRRCARPDCSATAAVTLVCDYGARTVLMAPAPEVPDVDDPARYDLCARHAARFRPPHGWELTVDATDGGVARAAGLGVTGFDAAASAGAALPALR
jgi:hypothetical protein